MKIIKKLDKDIKKEDAHGGSSSSKLYIADNELSFVFASVISNYATGRNTINPSHSMCVEV